MTRKKQVKVKTYRRKDGTIVRSSNRSVMTVGDKNVNKRQNTLGGHIRKGATVLGAIGGASGAIGGALVGGMVGGPIGAGVGAASYGTSGAFGGGISGAGYGAGTYYLKKKLAKDKSKRNFDYKREDNSMYEFERTLGGYSAKKRGKQIVIKTPKVRKREKQYKTAGMVGGGLGAAALTGAAILNRKKIGSAFKKMKTPKLPGAPKPKMLGPGSNFSRYNNNKQGDTNMFIGYMENEGYYEFARRKGSKDKKKRQRRSQLGTAAKVAGAGLAGAAILGAAAGGKGTTRAAGILARGAKRGGMGARLQAAKKVYGAGVARNASRVGGAASSAGRAASTFGSRVRNTVDKKRRMGSNAWRGLPEGAVNRGRALPAGR